MLNKYDNILKGITFNELITTIQNNKEKIIDQRTINEVFSEILESQLEDAYSLLYEYQKEIISQSKEVVTEV